MSLATSEERVDQLTSRIVRQILEAVVNEPGLTVAEARLVWMRVIAGLVKSVVVERQTDVIREGLGL